LGGVRIGASYPDRDGIPVRHELERIVQDVRPIQGPLLMYETVSPPSCSRPSFFGVLIFGRSRVPPWFYLFSTAMVALGTDVFGVLDHVNNSWMQVPTGYVVENGAFVPNDWTKIIFNSVVWSRFPHMLLASYLTGAFCVAATGGWYVLRKEYTPSPASCCAWALVSPPPC